MFHSGRSANANITQNLTNFVLIGGISVLFVVGLNRWIRRLGWEVAGMKWLGVLALWCLFAINIEWRNPHISLNPNLFYPNIQMLMSHGSEAFHLIKNVADIPRELVLSFLEPRFIFYIQPPLYLFTLATLFIFSVTCFF